MPDPTQPVPGPTREQIRSVIARSVIASTGAAWLDWDEAVDKMADAVLALLPARPSPTDDDLSARLHAALRHADRIEAQLDSAHAEIERLRAHQGTA